MDNQYIRLHLGIGRLSQEVNTDVLDKTVTSTLYICYIKLMKTNEYLSCGI